MDKTGENRGAPRLHAGDEFLIEFKDASSKLSQKAYGADLSVTGARFSSLRRTKKGETVDFTILFSPEYSGERELQIRARVIYVEGSKQSYYHKIGCQFEESPEKQEQLQKFIEWASKKPKRKPRVIEERKPRAASRVLADDKFVLQFKEGHKKYYDWGYGCDLSEDGASFTTLAPLTKGKVVKTTLNFHPDYTKAKTIDLNAKIVRVEWVTGKRYARIACRFDQAEDRKELREFIDWLDKNK